MSTNVSEELAASVFSVEEQSKHEISMKPVASRRNFHPKRPLTCNGLPSVISQKIGLFLTIVIVKGKVVPVLN
jgi:hypothetical protein